MPHGKMVVHNIELQKTRRDSVRQKAKYPAFSQKGFSDFLRVLRTGFSAQSAHNLAVLHNMLENDLHGII
jgi:hypothetical protein